MSPFRLVNYQTDRLSVRHWDQDLANAQARRVLEQGLVSVLTPKVLAHLPPSLQLVDGAVSEWIVAQENECDAFVIAEKNTGHLIGLMMLFFNEEPGQAPQAHLGYLLGEANWGRGFASEVIRGLVAALAPFAPLNLLGGVVVDNPASAKVLTRAGFVKDADLSTSDTEMFVLKLP